MEKTEKILISSRHFLQIKCLHGREVGTFAMERQYTHWLGSATLKIEGGEGLVGGNDEGGGVERKLCRLLFVGGGIGTN